MPQKTSRYRRNGRFSTLQGGIQLATAGGSKRFLTWPAITALTNGTDTAPVAGTRFTCSLLIPHNVTLTGIGYLLGTVGGTDLVILELHDADGTLIANSALAGTTAGTTATFQEISFTAPVEVVGPCWYFLSVTMNGTTARLRTIPTAVGVASTQNTKSATGTFGTLGTLTVPTTFTVNVGPIAYTF